MPVQTALGTLNTKLTGTFEYSADTGRKVFVFKPVINSIPHLIRRASNPKVTIDTRVCYVARQWVGKPLQPYLRSSYPGKLLFEYQQDSISYMSS